MQKQSYLKFQDFYFITKRILYEIYPIYFYIYNFNYKLALASEIIEQILKTIRPFLMHAFEFFSVQTV